MRGRVLRRSPALISREEGHRRALLLGLGALLLLSTGPIFGHHFAAGLEYGLRGRDHLGPLCLIAAHELLAPVHYTFHTLLAGGVLYALGDRIRAALRARHVLAPLKADLPHPGDSFHEAAVRAGVEPARIRIVEGLPAPAFTAGWLRPRIYVAQGLRERLSTEELTAMLAHEGAHVLRRDPLRLSALRFLVLTLFWIPALRRLADDLAAEAEVRADDHAAREHPLALASAILALATWGRPEPLLDDVVGFAQRASMVERRIRRLAGEEPVVQSYVTRGSIGGALLALALVWTSGAIMVHPLPTGTAGVHALHCQHPGRLAVTHLFCFPGAFRTDSDVCPHAR
jgi:Zn-dependent protease with chaperone function